MVASKKTEIFLKFVRKAKIDTSVEFNNEGTLIMRASNIKFTLDVKVRPSTAKLCGPKSVVETMATTVAEQEHFRNA